jgi:hypothetical protein
LPDVLGGGADVRAHVSVHLEFLEPAMSPGLTITASAITFGVIGAAVVACGTIWGTAAGLCVCIGAALAFLIGALMQPFFLANSTEEAARVSRGDVFDARAFDDVPEGAMVSIIERDGISGVVRAVRSMPICGSCGIECASDLPTAAGWEPRPGADTFPKRLTDFECPNCRTRDGAAA